MVQCLAWLTPEEHQWLTHPRTGLQTVCKYLPTPADVHEFLREKRARLENVKPAATTYKRLGDTEPGPWDLETDFERKRRVVRELLGYDPAPRSEPGKRRLEQASPDDLRRLELKTKPAPASGYLIAALKAEGWPHVPERGDG